MAKKRGIELLWDPGCDYRATIEPWSGMNSPKAMSWRSSQASLNRATRASTGNVRGFTPSEEHDGETIFCVCATATGRAEIAQRLWRGCREHRQRDAARSDPGARGFIALPRFEAPGPRHKLGTTCEGLVA